jgi:hypothetical protein
MIVILARVWDCGNGSILPLFIDLIGSPPIKREQPGSIWVPVFDKALEQILHRRVFGLVADQDHDIPGQEFTDEFRGRRGPEVGITKIGTGQNQIGLPTPLCRKPPMKVSHPGQRCSVAEDW